MKHFATGLVGNDFLETSINLKNVTQRNNRLLNSDRLCADGEHNRRLTKRVK
jgi:hypothetical protein